MWKENNKGDKRKINSRIAVIEKNGEGTRVIADAGSNRHNIINCSDVAPSGAAAEWDIAASSAKVCM